MKNMEIKIQNVGTVDCAKVNPLSVCELYIGMTDVSDVWKQEIQEGIQIGKEKFLKEFEKIVEAHGWKWSEKEVKVIPQLHILVEVENNYKVNTKAELSIFFHDAENKNLEESVYIPLDIEKLGNKFREDLKKVTANAITKMMF